ncbi:MAG: Holliday junction resolvase RuvX [Ruminococcaceae bacterium]|nr:Holliday junction resolvase RuvX [Oscillospiraceae bacterium]
MRLIGLDYGDSRIGVAVSDALGLTAQPVGTLSEKTWTKQLEKLAAIVQEYGAEGFVIGMPRNMNGSVGERGEITRKFSEFLQEKTGLPVTEWDERLSSVAAHRALDEGQVRNKKGKVDMLAAVFILQGYLDSLQK